MQRKTMFIMFPYFITDYKNPIKWAGLGVCVGGLAQSHPATSTPKEKLELPASCTLTLAPNWFSRGRLYKALIGETGSISDEEVLETVLPYI